LFNAESFSDSRVTGTFSVSSKFYKKNGDTVSGANSPIAITLTSSDQGQKKFYVTIPTDTPSCCLVSDAYQWRSGSCCLSSGEVVFDSSAAGAKNAASALNAAAAVLPDAVPSASHWGSIATPSGVINAHVTIHGAPLERVGVGVSISATVRSSFDPPGGFFDYAVLSNGVGVLVSGQVARDGLVTFTTTNTMQSAQLVVYVGNDGNGGESVNVVACAKPIGVTTTAANNQRGLPQNVTLSLDVLETTPGSGVSLTATTTAPGSRVYLLAHDVSVILQSKGTQSAMSASKVSQAAAATLGVSETDGDTTFDPMSQMSGGLQCYPPADIDATQVLLVTAMKTNTCVPNGFGGMIEDEMMMAMPLAAPEMAFKSNVAETDTAGASALSADADDSDSSPTETIQTRRFFPETWVWRSVDTDNSTGIGQLDDLRAPDTITRWRFRAFSSHPSLGIGVADELADASVLTVSKPFFVRPFLPYSAVRGETVTVRVGVFNDLNFPVTANVGVVANDSNFELVSSSGSVQVTVPAKSSGSTNFSIRPKKLGDIEVGIFGTTNTVSDAVVKTLKIVPEGFPKVSTVNAVVRRTDGENASIVSLLADLPDASRIVPGSVIATLTLIGDVMGPSLSGLEKLVQMPFGCGEQNMITLAPNAAAMKYLSISQKATREISEKASRNVNVGYQRQLTYRHESGAFSAFGEREYDGGTNPGSVWLTAFVLRTFANAEAVAELDFSPDETILTTAAAFLASQQNPNGSFTDPSPPIHTEMTGAAGAGVGLAAYCLLAMVDGGRSSLNVGRAIAYVSQSMDTVNGNAYVVAIAARALTNACLVVNQGCDAAESAREKLQSMGVENADGTKHWGGVAGGSNTGELSSAEFSGTRVGKETSTQVEATGYATIAFVEAGDLETAYQGARWLMLRRNANGGFRSTQDTVVGLEALSRFASATLGTEFSLDVTVEPNGFGLDSFVKSVTSDTFDVLQRVDVGNTTELKLTVTGAGTALAQLSVTYNLVQDPSSVAYDLIVTAKAVVADNKKRRFFSRRKLLASSVVAGEVLAEDVDTVEITACTKRADGVTQNSQGMVLLEVGLFTGFAATVDSLDSIRLVGAGLARRVDADDRLVTFYLEDVTDEETCVTFDTAKLFGVANLQPAVSTVKAYYHPEQVTVTDVKADTLGLRVGARDATESVTVGGDPANARRQAVSKGTRFDFTQTRVACFAAAAVAACVLG